MLGMTSPELTGSGRDVDRLELEMRSGRPPVRATWHRRATHKPNRLIEVQLLFPNLTFELQ